MEKDDLQRELKSATVRLQRAVADFNDASFNVVPPNGGWSAREVIEHLLILESSVNKLLQTPGVPAERDFGKKLGMIYSGLADSVSKYNAPRPFIPSKECKEKQPLLNGLLIQRNQLANNIERLNLEEMITASKHPFMGSFTRYEWIVFIVHHSNRHAGQIERLQTTL